MDVLWKRFGEVVEGATAPIYYHVGTASLVMVNDGVVGSHT